MKKEKNILILPLISLGLAIIGIILPLLFIPIPGGKDRMEIVMYLPFLLAFILGVSVFTHSIKNIKQEKSWKSSLIFCFISGGLILIMIILLAFTNVYDLFNLLSR